MKKLLYIANWKSHKTSAEAVDWLQQLNISLPSVDFEGREIIVCPSFPALSGCASTIRENKLPVRLGAQDVSAFGEGAYTGEVYASQIKEFAEFVIIGHSERKRYNHETDEEVSQKVNQAKRAGLTVILCIQNENSPIDENADIVAYEPLSAIGTGVPDNPAHVKEVFQAIRDRGFSRTLLYGGSVNKQDVLMYTAIEELGGFLIGGASLEASSFLDLLNAC